MPVLYREWKVIDVAKFMQTCIQSTTSTFSGFHTGYFFVGGGQKFRIVFCNWV